MKLLEIRQDIKIALYLHKIIISGKEFIKFIYIFITLLFVTTTFIQYWPLPRHY